MRKAFNKLFSYWNSVKFYGQCKHQHHNTQVNTCLDDLGDLLALRNTPQHQDHLQAWKKTISLKIYAFPAFFLLNNPSTRRSRAAFSLPLPKGKPSPVAHRRQDRSCQVLWDHLPGHFPAGVKQMNRAEGPSSAIGCHCNDSKSVM